jgi:pyruvate, orthophosphate dikinase
MENAAEMAHDICRLDYLVGTLATAYKGVIRSLVIKDFCMTDGGYTTIFKGTILAVPHGYYEASLNKSGVELSRSPLQNGYFEFAVDSSRIADARDLQIDIIQIGRHIGTFLLKKETAGGLYLSAVELSEELASIDLTRLTTPLHDKVGLLQKAEEIVAQIHSTKKDWASFSEALNGFAIDFYWNVPDDFYDAFDILVRFALRAAERASCADRCKAVSNYFNLLELPLNADRDQKSLRPLAETWLKMISRSTIDLSSQTMPAVAMLKELLRKFPGIEISGVLALLVSSLQKKRKSVTFLNNQLLTSLGKFISIEDRDFLSKFGEPGQLRTAQKLAEVEQQLATGDANHILDMIAEIDILAFDERQHISAFFDIAEQELTAESANTFAEAMGVYLSSANQLSIEALASMRMKTSRIMEKLITNGRLDICAVLLRRMRDLGPFLFDQIMLDPRFARSVLNSGHNAFIMQYVLDLKKITIPAARVQGISPETWAEIVNPLHLERLSKFMELLMIGDEKLESVLIHVIANLIVSGVLIPDDRLFQRQVSAYLNSPTMQGQFLLHYLLLERFPVYFNDVGAASKLRDYSTEIDSWGNDPVIYFVRKQVHVNASSHNIRLIDSVLRFWTLNDSSFLKEVVPPDVYSQINPDLVTRYASVIGCFFRAAGIEDATGLHLDKLLWIPDEVLDAQLRKADHRDAEAREKVRLLCKLYKEVVKKYSLLSRDAAVGDVHTRLHNMLIRLRGCKRTVLSKEKTEPQENLYFKRHIAFGIPSVLGTYREIKFDAMKDMMSCAEDIPVILESIIFEIEKKGAAAELSEIQKWLAALTEAWEILKIYGMQNSLIDEYGKVLEHNWLHLTQIIDVLRMWQKELAWMVSAITRFFHEPLKEVIEDLPHDDLPEHLKNLEIASPDFLDKAADIVMRDLISYIPGLVEIDRLLASLVNAIHSRVLSGGDSVLEIGETHPTLDFYDIHAISLRDAIRLAPDLGSKAKNLVIVRDGGLTTPAGAVLPAHHTKNYELFTTQREFMDILKEAVSVIEARTHRSYGGTSRPLFLSVRSGSYLSMPGILSSILYCGMNNETLDAFIRTSNNPALGWDSYQKFIEHFGMLVLGLERGFFDQITREYGIVQPRSPAEAGGPLYARSIAGQYISRLRSRGLTIPSDVYEQLRLCARAVYASWFNDRARQFRSATDTSEEWGTSVTLMEMVSGNQAGAGATVFFTKNPQTLAEGIVGETRENASGDDLVSGRKSGQPLSRAQTAAGQKSLEDTDPELYHQHQKAARSIEDAFNGLPQEVEATYTTGKSGRYILSVIQTRRMEQGERYFNKFDEICSMEARVIGRGVGASGGALSGVASFAASREQIELLKKESGLPVILMRKTANTNDVSLMPFIKGIITAAGGVTSHAAVLAQKFGISAVVSCADMNINDDEPRRPYGIIGITRIQEGAAISIDGTNGLVFSGLCFQLKNSPGTTAEAEASL